MSGAGAFAFATTSLFASLAAVTATDLPRIAPSPAIAYLLAMARPFL